MLLAESETEIDNILVLDSMLLTFAIGTLVIFKL